MYYYMIEDGVYNYEGVYEVGFIKEGDALTKEGCVDIFRNWLKGYKYRTLRSLGYEYDPNERIHKIIATVTDWYYNPLMPKNRKEGKDYIIRFWKEG